MPDFVGAKASVTSNLVNASGQLGVTIQPDGTKDYNKLNNKPLIEVEPGLYEAPDDDTLYRIWDNLDHPSVNSYNDLEDKPSIEGVVLQGDKTISQIGVGTMTEQDIDNLLYG